MVKQPLVHFHSQENNNCLILPLITPISILSTEEIDDLYKLPNFSEDDYEAIDIIRGMSPVAWQHINLFGTFEFSPELSKINIDGLVASYAEPSYLSNLLKEGKVL